MKQIQQKEFLDNHGMSSSSPKWKRLNLYSRRFLSKASLINRRLIKRDVKMWKFSTHFENRTRERTFNEFLWMWLNERLFIRRLCCTRMMSSHARCMARKRSVSRRHHCSHTSMAVTRWIIWPTMASCSMSRASDSFNSRRTPTSRWALPSKWLKTVDASWLASCTAGWSIVKRPCMSATRSEKSTASPCRIKPLVNYKDYWWVTSDLIKGGSSCFRLILQRDARGSITFKIVPSYRSAPPPCEVRA